MTAVQIVQDYDFSGDFNRPRTVWYAWHPDVEGAAVEGDDYEDAQRKVAQLLGRDVSELTFAYEDNRPHYNLRYSAY